MRHSSSRIGDSWRGVRTRSIGIGLTVVQTLTLVACFLAPTLNCAADDATAAVAPTHNTSRPPHTTRVLRIGWFERGHSFLDYENEYGIHQGLNPDYLHHIATPQGYAMTYKYFDSVPQTFQALDRGDIDIVPSMLDDQTRSAQYWVSPTYSTQQVGVVVRSGVSAPQTLQQLNGYRIASEVGSISRQRLQSALDHARFVDVNSAHEGIAAVAQGRADAYVGLQTVNVATIAWLGLGTLRSAVLPHVTIGLHFVTRRDNANAIAVIQNGLARLTPAQRATIEATWLSALPVLPGNPVRKPTAEQAAWLRQHSPLRVGIYSFEEPYDFLDDTNRWRGTGESLLSAFAIIHHIRIEPVLLSALDNPLEELRQGNVDTIAAAPVSNVSPDQALVSVPYDTIPWVLISRTDAAHPLALVGATSWRLQHLLPNPSFTAEQLSSFPTSNDAINALLKHQVDSAFINLVAANRLGSELKDGKLTVNGHFAATEQIGFAVSPDNPQLLEMLNDFIQTYPRDQLQDIVRRNHPTPVSVGYQSTAILRIAAPIGLAVAALFGFLLWAYWRIRKAGKLASQARAEADLARELAEAADRAKSTFLATMSHEIRTPLSGIVGVIDVLQTTSLTTFQQHYVELARQSTKLLMGVINDVLDFSKIEAGKLSIEATPVKVYALAEHLSGLYEPLTRPKGIGFFVSVMPHFDREIVIDEVRVSQILTNLVSNAIRFTTSGYVHIKFSFRCGAATPMLYLSVCDTGSGMPASYLAHLFEPFVQADGSTTRRFGGTGLGLSIVKRLVDLMDGRIDVSSVVDHGTRVNVALPFIWGTPSEAPLERDQVHRTVRATVSLQTSIARPAIFAWCKRLGIVHTEINDGTEWSIVEESIGRLKLYHRGEASAQPLVCSSALRVMLDKEDLDRPAAIAGVAVPDIQPSAETAPIATRLLLAEDNDINREIIEHQLLALGISPLTARDGVDALEQWHEIHPAIMLVDCQMPRMDGYELARQIRLLETQTQPTRHTLIIAITANASTADQQECLAAGMDDFLSKPLTRQKLADMLHKWGAAESTLSPETRI